MADLIIRERKEQSLRDLCYVLFRHKHKATWFFGGIMALVLVVTFVLPEVFQSEAKVLVRLGRESVALDPTATTSGQVVSVSPRRESEIKSEMEILNSRDLAEKVVDAIGVERFQRDRLSRLSSFFFPSDPVKQRDAVVRHLMKTWKMEIGKDSNIIAITYDDQDPKLAHDVVQKLLDFYLEKHIAVNRTAGSYGFFQDQTVKLGQELAQAEKALESMKNSTGISSVDEHRRILLEQLGVLQKGITEADSDMVATRNKIKAIKQLITETPQTIVMGNTKGFPNYAADGMRQKVYELQLKEQDLRSKYTDKNVLVQEVQRQIGIAESLLKREAPTRNQVTNGINPAYQELKLAMVKEESAVAALAAKKDSLVVHLASVKSELQGFNNSEVQLARLQREKDIQEANYRKYNEKMEQARIDSALEMQKISNISVAQAATDPIKPISPKKGLNLALGFMFGGLGAVGLAFMAEYNDHSLKRPGEVERKLRVPLLATIPQFSLKKLTDGPVKTTRPLLLPGVRTQCGLLSHFEECCETLSDRLLHPAEGSTLPRVIAVTSCRDGEGVSTVAANLALTLARKGDQRVLLVEANHLNPAAHKIFGIKVIPGLTDIEGQGEVISSNSLRSSNLDVVQSGKGEISLYQLADSREFSEHLNLWKMEYDFVILDIPAIFQTSSTLKLSRLVDAVVLVVEAEKVRCDSVRKALVQLGQAKANVLGIVLNKRMFHIPEWLYNRI
jgi:capsular exopolysaccharide synthesis family protein